MTAPPVSESRRLGPKLAWSDGRSGWRHEIHLALVLVGAAVIWWGDQVLTLGQQAGIWGVMVIAQVLRLRWLWRPFFGAVFFFELIRTARGGRHVWLRCAYASVLLIALLLLYWEWFVVPSGEWLRFWTGGTIRVNDVTALTAFTESFSNRLFIVQFALVVLLTPALTAGAIGEEKSRGTLEFLLISALDSYEVVVGKMAARLAYLALLVFTGLPFLSLLQLLGGLEPALVLAGFAATGITMFSLAGLSMLNSVYPRTSLTAILLTYVEVAAYGITSTWLVRWGGPVAADEGLLRWFNAGNIAAAVERLLAWQRGAAGSGNVSLLAELPAVLRDYALFHVLAAIGCIGWASARLRARYRRQTSTGNSQSPWRARRPPRRVWSAPLLWKEICAEPILRLKWTGWLILAVFIAVSVFMVLYAEARLSFEGSLTKAWSAALDRWGSVLGTLLSSLMLVGVAVRASANVSGERDRGTLDALLSSPLANGTILLSKWLGSIFCVRWGFCLLLGLSLLGGYPGELSILGMFFLVPVWAIYAAFFATLGLYFSLTRVTTLRATTRTLAVLFVLTICPWLFRLVFLLLVSSSMGSKVTDDAGQSALVTAGWSPPETLYRLAAEGWKFSEPDSDLNPFRSATLPPDTSTVRERVIRFWYRLDVPLPWLACYVVITVLLWLVIGIRFSQVTRRMPIFGKEGRAQALRKRPLQRDSAGVGAGDWQ